MENIINSFSISFLLRSVFSGFFFVLSFLVTQYGFDFPMCSILKDYLFWFTLITSASVISGVSVYIIHRNSTFALIEWLMNSQSHFNCRRRCPLISYRSRELLFRRWTFDRSQQQMSISNNLSTWADYTHFLYVSAQCIAFGGLVGFCLSDRNLVVDVPMFTIAVAFAILGFISDWRWHSTEDFISSNM